MKVLVTRNWKKDNYTIGRMYVNGKKFANTLEDKDRGLKQNMPIDTLKKMKVYGKTAIPTGTYKIKSYYWAKHKQYYPWIQNVPAYEGILIHGGTTDADTLGCILVGENTQVGKLTNCTKYVRELTAMIQTAEKKGEEIEITII